MYRKGKDNHRGQSQPLNLMAHNTQLPDEKLHEASKSGLRPMKRQGTGPGNVMGG